MTADVVPMRDASPDAFRTLPHNLEAEKAVLGAVFVNVRAWEKIGGVLKPEHFALAQHGRIFAACEAMFSIGQVADPITLARYFEQEQSLVDIGGQKYLFDLAHAAGTVINAGEYARLIRDLYRRRRLIEVGQQAVARAHAADPGEDAQALRAEIDRALFDLFDTDAATDGDPLAMSAVSGRALTWIEDRYQNRDAGGRGTGLADVDRAIGGMQAGDVVVLAGRPAMGKTALAGQIAYATATAGVPTLTFSLEMPAEQLQVREIAARTGIKASRIRAGEIGSAEFDAIVCADDDLKTLPHWIDDRPGLTIDAMRNAAKALHRRRPLGLVVVDYLQLIEGPGNNRVDVVTTVTRRLKTLARELGCPVLALSQLSRQVEQRDDKRPHLADLRESGSIEQDADMVLFLYRDEYYLERETPRRGERDSDQTFADKTLAHETRLADAKGVAEVIVAKNRHGPTSTVRVHFNAERMRFGNLDRERLL